MTMTTQHSELDKIKTKIKALAAKTVDRGATEEEATSAMNLVGRLLLQYNLSMNELEVRDATYKTIYLDIGRKNRHPVDQCAPALADLVGAETWFHRRGSKTSA